MNMNNNTTRLDVPPQGSAHIPSLRAILPFPRRGTRRGLLRHRFVVLYHTREHIIKRRRIILHRKVSCIEMKVNTNTSTYTSNNVNFRLLLRFVCLSSWSVVNALAMMPAGTPNHIIDMPFSLKKPPPSTTAFLGSEEDQRSSSPEQTNDDGTLAALFGSQDNRNVFFRHYLGTRSPVHIRRSQVELNDCSFLLQQFSACSPSTTEDKSSTLTCNNPRSTTGNFLIEHLFESCPYVTLRQNGMPRAVDKATMTWTSFQEQIQHHGCSAVIPVVQEPGFQALRSSLEACFQKSVVMTIYHSGPNASALLPHIDSYDVLVLQLEGCKDWEIVQGHAETRRSTPLMLQPGDVLYIPYNIIHSARTTVGYESTTHLTIGLLNKWKPDDTLNYSKSINQQQKSNDMNSQ
jgi:Cupin superfamily protein